jgi:hypothetical protein
MVYKLITEGKIKAVRIGKRGLRISEPSLEEFIEKNTIDPAAFVLGVGIDCDLKYGDFVVIPLDSTKYNELAGDKLMVVDTTDMGVYVQNKDDARQRAFVEHGEYNIPQDIDCEIHGGHNTL